MTFREQLKESIGVVVGLSAPVILSLTTAWGVEALVGNPYNIKTMDRVQPWIWMYDINQDGRLGEEDKTMVGYIGMGGFRAVYDRSPTEEEIEWYNSH